MSMLVSNHRRTSVIEPEGVELRPILTFNASTIDGWQQLVVVGETIEAVAPTIITTHSTSMRRVNLLPLELTSQGSTS